MAFHMNFGEMTPCTNHPDFANENYQGNIGCAIKQKYWFTLFLFG